VAECKTVRFLTQAAQPQGIEEKSHAFPGYDCCAEGFTRISRSSAISQDGFDATLAHPISLLRIAWGDLSRLGKCERSLPSKSPQGRASVRERVHVAAGRMRCAPGSGEGLGVRDWFFKYGTSNIEHPTLNIEGNEVSRKERTAMRPGLIQPTIQFVLIRAIRVNPFLVKTGNDGPAATGASTVGEHGLPREECTVTTSGSDPTAIHL
jgi:hypothetical protein